MSPRPLAEVLVPGAVLTCVENTWRNEAGGTSVTVRHLHRADTDAAGRPVPGRVLVDREYRPGVVPADSIRVPPDRHVRWGEITSPAGHREVTVSWPLPVDRAHRVTYRITPPATAEETRAA